MSQHDGETKEIDGYTYKVLMLDPLAATDLLADLGFILAPTLGALGGVLVKERGDAINKIMDGFDEGEYTSIDKAVENAVLGFFQRFDKAKQRELINLLAKVSFVVQSDGKEPRLSDQFAMHFKGRVASLYKWLAFALRVQFQDFFSGMDGAISRVAQRMTEAAESSPPAT